MNQPTHSVFLKGVSYPVFVDTTTANYDGDCVAFIAPEKSLDGWILLADNEKVASKALYLDRNRNLRMLRALENGQEYTATIELLSPKGKPLVWDEEVGQYTVAE